MTLAAIPSLPARTTARVVAAALVTVVAAGSWDVWWHAVLGRDSFWEPPHILLQAAVVVGLVAAAFAWLRGGDRRFRPVALASLLAPASAPFDELWHRAFGVESVSSPLIIWSPPHLLLVGGLLTVGLVVLPLLDRDADQAARTLFMAAVYGAVLQMVLFLAVPLDPFGPYHLLGPAGAAFQAFLLTLVLLRARRHMRTVGSAVLTAVFFLMLAAITVGEGLGGSTAPGVFIPPHPHPPPWITVFTFMLPALFLDVFASRIPRWVAGGASGILSTGFVYTASWWFIEPAFRYGLSEAMLAVGVAVVGGIAASLLVGPPGFEPGTNAL